MDVQKEALSICPLPLKLEWVEFRISFLKKSQKECELREAHRCKNTAFCEERNKFSIVT